MSVDEKNVTLIRDIIRTFFPDEILSDMSLEIEKDQGCWVLCLWNNKKVGWVIASSANGEVEIHHKLTANVSTEIIKIPTPITIEAIGDVLFTMGESVIVAGEIQLSSEILKENQKD